VKAQRMALLSVPLRGAEVERVPLGSLFQEGKSIAREFSVAIATEIRGKTYASGQFQGSNLSSRVPADRAKHSGRMRENATFSRHGSRESPRVAPISAGSCGECLRAVRPDGC